MQIKEMVKKLLNAVKKIFWRANRDRIADSTQLPSIQEEANLSSNSKTRIGKKNMVKDRIRRLLDALNKGVYEREDVLKLALLSSVAGESIFLLGPPGVAKSLVARKLKFAYKDAEVFEYLMSKFSTPEEIFGPISVKKLIEKDTYERVVDKYLPKAEVVFLDEIWKAGPPIQNALLTIINEKIFRNGGEEIKVPMKALISASNELPAKDQGLEALWDRFLVRLIVKGIENRENFEKMISDTSNVYGDVDKDVEKISIDEYSKWSKAIDEIDLPENVKNVIHNIRIHINEYNEKQDNDSDKIYVSDRRWHKIVRLLRTSAFLNDRTEVDLMDCFLITHCIWNEESQYDSAYQFVAEAIEEFGYKFELDFSGINDEISELEKDIEKETVFVKDDKHEVLVSARERYYEIQQFEINNYYTGNHPTPGLILQTDYSMLTTVDSNVNIYYYRQNYNSVENDNRYSVREGKDKLHVIINNHEYKLKTRIDGNKILKTRRPHKSVEEAWDKQVSNICDIVDKWEKNLDRYRSKDLEHIRNNIFVKFELAKVVEKSILSTSMDIKEIGSKVKLIQKSYKDLKEQEEIIS